MLSPMNREIGTILHAAPACANQGVLRSVFARVIVGLLSPSEEPKLKHLRVLAGDDPSSQNQCKENQNRCDSGPCEENRCRYKQNGHPRGDIKPQLRPGLIQSLVDG